MRHQINGSWTFQLPFGQARHFGSSAGKGLDAIIGGWDFSLMIASVYDGLGDKDSTFRWLALALKERSDLLVSLKVDPVFASLRSDP